MSAAIRKHLGDVLAIFALAVLGLGIGAYILSQQRLRFPLVQDGPFVVRAELENAQAVQPGQGQTVRVAGVEVGQIGKVELEDGRAVVELRLERKYKGLIRADATALLRSKTGLKDMFLEVDPGEGRPLREQGRIHVANTAPDVDPDEIFSALDSDTRSYLKLLISGAGKGLDGRGNDLREALRRLGPLHRDLAKVNTAVARRRTNLKRLVHNYGKLTVETGKKDREIVRLVRASNSVFQSLAAEDQNISSAVEKLPGSLHTTANTLGKVERFGNRLGPALDSLRPPFRKLDAANRAVLPLLTEAEPILRRQIRPFARTTTPYLRDLGAGARDLSKGSPQLVKTVGELNRLFNIGAFNKDGAQGLSGDLARDRARDEGFLYWLGWTIQNTTSLFSTSDAQGPFRRIFLQGLDCGLLTALTQQETEQLPEPLRTLIRTERGGIYTQLGAAGVCNP